LLDEPTNDLDIQTLTVLENYLDEFTGAVVTVSHDRFFLDRTAQSILAFEPNGHIRHYVGNYSDYRQNYQAAMKVDTVAVKPPVASTVMTNHDQKKLKFSYKEQQEFEQIDEWIEQTEQQLQKINETMLEASSDF